jgi:hypothetical protein
MLVIAIKGAEHEHEHEMKIHKSISKPSMMSF